MGIVDDFMVLSAAANQQWDVLQLFINNGANIHAFVDCALETAARYEKWDMVRFLVEKGAKVDVSDDLVIWKAAETGHFETVRFLVNHGVSIQAHVTALLAAVVSRHWDIVRFLLPC